MSFKEHLKTTNIENSLKTDIDEVLNKHEVDVEYLHKVYPVNKEDSEKE